MGSTGLGQPRCLFLALTAHMASFLGQFYSMPAAFPIRYTMVLASWFICWHLDAPDSTSALMRDPCKDSDLVTHFLALAAALGNNGPWSWILWPPHHCNFHAFRINNIWTVLPSSSASLSYKLVSLDSSSISVYVRTLQRTFFRQLI